MSQLTKKVSKYNNIMRFINNFDKKTTLKYFNNKNITKEIK